jgi:L,D-transpeptidase ErfK/SrfK
VSYTNACHGTPIAFQSSVLRTHLTRLATVLLLAGVVDALPGQAQGPDSEPLTGQVTARVLAPGDTLTSLGARYGVAARTLAFDNSTRLDTPLVAGRTLRIDNRHIVPTGGHGAILIINIPQRMLFYRGDQATAGLPVAPGRPTWPTPTGDFRVATRQENPTWNVPASILAEARRAGRPHPTRVPPGPQNPLGAFWLGLDSGGVGIHGTNAPASIYRFASHGCIRLHPDDIAWLFPRVAVGTTVALIYQPVLLTLAGNRVFLEVHPDIYELEAPTLARVRALAAAQELAERIDWDAAARVLDARHGVARDVTWDAPR